MGVKISELPAASALAGDELIPVVQAGETRKAAISALPTGSSTTIPNIITTTYVVPADTSIMAVGTLEITATGALDNSGNVGVW